MPSFNFQKQFADDVESGVKRQTIRGKRKNPPRVGQTAHLFTGLRTKNCRKLGAHRINTVADVVIHSDCVLIRQCWWQTVLVRKKKLNEFAVADGFKDWNQMRAWFQKTYSLPFGGDLIKWDF